MSFRSDWSAFRPLRQRLLLGAALLTLSLVASWHPAHAAHAAAAADAQAGGVLHTLTNADNGSTITIPVGDAVELRLPVDFDWNVSISDATVLHRPPIALVRGVQGFWNAAVPGTSVISASGGVNCAPGMACIALAAVFSATVVVTGTAPAPVTAVYQPGWNLVGGTTGTTFPVTLYHWDAVQQAYRTNNPGTPIQGGEGYWGYFSASTTVTLKASAAQQTLATAPGGRFIMAGNPWSDACAGINVGPPSPGGQANPNVLAVFSYDPQRAAYSSSSGALLAPGEGVWLLLANDAPLPLLRLPLSSAGSCIAPP